MNLAVIIGNITKDPDTRTTNSGIVCTTFTIAVNRPTKGDDGKHEADYISVVTWRQLAEICAKYLAKGRKVGVTGRIQTRTYDAKDGTKRYVTEVVAENVEFLTPMQNAAPATVAPTQEPQQRTVYDQGNAYIQDDELPF
jgi:single-strand DNA-binding protein